MNIAKALKTKNNFVKEIKKIQDKIVKYNSRPIGGESPFNVKDLYLELSKKVDELVTLKAKISGANAPVQDKIYRLSEAKSLTQFLKDVPTKAGTVPGSRFSETERSVEYVAAISTEAMSIAIDNLEKDIEFIQDELDTFNHITQI